MVIKKLKEIKDSILGRVNETIQISVSGEKEASAPEYSSEDYIELDSKPLSDASAKILVKYFILTDFPDIKPVIDSLREGYTVALIKIKPLRDKDMTDLKRAISKIKKTVEAIEGDLVGIDEDWIVAVPRFVSIYKGENTSETSY